LVFSDDSKDFEATGVRKEERGKRYDEAIVLMKKPWTRATLQGYYSVRDPTLLLALSKRGPPVWVGGAARLPFRARGGSDGWLVSSVTSSEVAAGIEAIRGHAAEVGREIPEDHYGVLVPYVFANDSEEALRIAGPSIRRRQDIPPSDYSALGRPDQVRSRIQEYIDAGATKFVMRPYGPKETHVEQVRILAKEVIPETQREQGRANVWAMKIWRYRRRSVRADARRTTG
jgi:alkanesulfonate monooxygenase SsuD/methylene tetrahydromethanopterin reductase-like flavin-dependent oxidoreductase (luciferase family)